MKISYIMQNGANILHPPYDGPAEHVRNVVLELIKLGHEVNILFCIKGQYYFSSDLTHFDIINPFEHENKIFRYFEKAVRKIQSLLHLPYLAYFESLRFSRVCRRYLANTDIFLERISWMGYGGRLVKKILNKPLVIEFNGDPLHDLNAKNEAPKGLQLIISKKTYRDVLLHADKIIASGDGWRSNLIDQWQINPKKIITIENGTTLVENLHRDDLNAFSKQTSSQEPIKIIYLGGFYPWHGTDILIEAFSTCLENYPQLQLTLIGAGSGLEATKKIVKGLNLQDSIQFTGQLSPDEFAPLLASSDIAVSPYCGWVEYSGLKLFDYKAAGLAIIASGENGQPKTIEQGKTGMIVPPCDRDALIQGLSLLIEDQQLRTELGMNARIDAELTHSWKHTGQKVENLLTQVVTGELSS